MAELKMNGNETGARASLAYRAAVGVLIIYAFAFILLSVDLMMRVWAWRRGLATRDIMALMFFEVSRSLVTAGVIALLIRMLMTRDSPRWRPLAIAIALAGIWHTKAFGFAAFPGAKQEALAVWLRAHQVSPRLLAFIFASPAWALWGATSALLRFSVAYPEPLTAESIRASHGRDRTGLLRSSPLAGADVGSIFREVSAWLLERGWLETIPLTAAALAWCLLFQVFGHHPLTLACGGLLLAFAIGLIVTNLRAVSAGTTDVHVRAPIQWLARAATAGLALFALSAAATFLLRGPASFAGVILLGLAPAGALVCCWFAVARGR